MRNSSITWIFLWRVPIQNHPKPSITVKRRNKAKYLTWNSIRLSLWRRPASQTLSKALDISSATAQAAPCLLKTLKILSDTTAQKRPHFSWWSKILLLTSFSKTLLITARTLTWRYFLAGDLSPTFLHTKTTIETFQQSGKQNSFRHILNSSASIYESSGSQFFRTTTGIKSGPHAFDESRFFMTFLTLLGLTEILCSFRLLLEGKIVKEILESSRLEFLEKSLANSFALSDVEDNTLSHWIEEVQQTYLCWEHY